MHDTHDITETFQKTFTKPVILTSSYNVSYNTSLLLEQVWRSYNPGPEKYSAMNIEIGISQNTKCVIWNSFPKSSHNFKEIFILCFIYIIKNTLWIWGCSPQTPCLRGLQFSCPPCQ